MKPINWNELLEDPSAIEASPLQRVIGVGVGRIVKGITIELIALEVREFGTIGSMRMEVPSSPPGVFYEPEIVVRDDAATRYASMNISGSSESPGRGATVTSRYLFSIVPVVPSNATRLEVLVTRIGNQMPLGPVGRTSDPFVVEGPWKFEVPLGK